MLDRFWKWYERHYALNVSIATIAFALQVVHLYWLGAHVVALRLIGESFFTVTPLWETIIILVDFLEIPTIISVSLIYLNTLRTRFDKKSLIFLLFLNSQWLHIFWITDEFVVERLSGAGAGTILPIWLAWVAIGIDYLELPVIYDTLKRFWQILKSKGVRSSFSAFKETD